jgi:hypothetical protein
MKIFVAGYWLLVTGYWLLVTGYWFSLTATSNKQPESL